MAYPGKNRQIKEMRRLKVAGYKVYYSKLVTLNLKLWMS